MLSGGTLEQWGVQPLSREGDRRAWDGGKRWGDVEGDKGLILVLLCSV